jgi:HSP20 family protein
MPEKSAKPPVRSEKKTVAPAKEHWSPFDSLRREIDRLFDDFQPMNWRSPFGRHRLGLDIEWPRPATWQIAPAMDLVERDKEFEITAELPGMEEKDIDIKLSNGALVIKGEKTEEKEEREKDYHLSERRYGSFQRSFALPDGIDMDKITANFAKGVLTVRLPKTAEARKNEKKIAVKSS